MIKTMRFILAIIISFVGIGISFAQSIEFSKETFTFNGNSLPYRKASIPGNGDKASLVVYLHGGSSRGSDNETQMNEPGINSISQWLAEKGRKAIMVVPQCPSNGAWISLQQTVKNLLQTFIDRGVADAAKVYIFGGSMGGTGTWNIVAANPGFFASAMPVAGNPSGLDAEAVSHTPVYTVMGTADRIMSISNVEPFLAQLDTFGGEYRYDIEDGWTHEDVCKNSYTEPRLNWIFSHTGSSSDGIAPLVSTALENVLLVEWHDLSGRLLPVMPKQHGIYLKTTLFTDGKCETRKISF